MDVVQEVRTYIETHRLLLKGDRVVVGVSGGTDSVALLHVLRALAESLDLHLHVAHLNHGLRGADADADADAVQAISQMWHLPCSVERVDVPSVVAREKLTLEEASRRARYAFLSRVAVGIAATKVAVAHNADDQSETVLMHLLRGAGPAGLRGMLPATRLQAYHLAPFLDPSNVPADLQLVRPFLEIPRVRLEQYCSAHNLPTRFDRSNLDTTFFRNKLRLQVLPYLEEVSPRIGERLRHLAHIVEADYELLQELVDSALGSLLVGAYPEARVFDLLRWREQPLAIQRAIIRQSVYELCCSLRDVDFRHVEDAVTVAQHGSTGAEAILPRGLSLTVGYSTLTIGDASVLRLPPERPWLSPAWEAAVPIPGSLRLEHGWMLEVQRVPQWDPGMIAGNPNPLVAWMDAEALGSLARVRARRIGDRFVPQGMHGAEVRLSDFLINAKLPRRWRDHLPLIEVDGRILWVAGVRLSDLARVRAETRQVVRLELTPQRAAECREVASSGSDSESACFHPDGGVAGVSPVE